ncbi:MAG: enoyl-CoA hydratase/isomerase family protein [Gammaproteobacteria bacterium]|jgi:enoyl-CoA hydratase/carnithine racemase
MIELFDHGQIVELRLDRPPVNAINADLLEALNRGLDDAARAEARALVISGQPGMFSAGLDVPGLLRLSRPEMLAFWEQFFGSMGRLAASPVPVAAAITGHSPAGGAVLALFCDYRIAARGEFRIGLNEVQVGLPVPEPVFHAMARTVGRAQAERLCVRGLLIEPDEARDIGLVHELRPAEEVVARAVAWCDECLSLPQKALATTRRLARADLAGLFENLGRETWEAMNDAWFSEETQATMRALVEKLAERRKK